MTLSHLSVCKIWRYSSNKFPAYEKLREISLPYVGITITYIFFTNSTAVNVILAKSLNKFSVIPNARLLFHNRPHFYLR